jgi:UDP-3-O-[3-hydroxymyristoyl] glucosamine N-acyltransferase
MNIGDKVQVDGMTGVVVALFSEGKFAPGFPATEWAYLKVGVLVDTAEAGLIHFPDAERLRIDQNSK